MYRIITKTVTAGMVIKWERLTEEELLVLLTKTAFHLNLFTLPEGATLKKTSEGLEIFFTDNPESDFIVKPGHCLIILDEYEGLLDTEKDFDKIEWDTIPDILYGEK